MNNKTANIVATVLFSLMTVLSVFSMKNDSLTFDELAHIPAGYSYVKYQDYRVNPEHPPLIKSLSGIPLLFKDLNFPVFSESWKQSQSPAWWVQFDLGNEFVYQSGNNPKEIIFYSRLPMILILLLLGIVTFNWARKIGGNEAAIGVAALFSFSPTLIAHGRLVTTDVGAALGVVLATLFWIKFLKNPKFQNVILAGLSFGIAMLMKFSLALLIPFFVILSFVYPLLFKEEKLKNLVKYLVLSLIAGIIGMLFVVWPTYALFVKNYPIDHQIRDTIADLSPNQIPILKNLTISMAHNELLRPMAQYFRGVLMATQRTVFGNTVFFLGEMSAKGWWYYFPIIYFLKEPIALHILTIMAIIGAITFFLKKNEKMKEKLKKNFTLLSFILFITIYWAAAIGGNLNIGVRHLIPTLPFLFILVAMGIKSLILRSSGKKRIIITSSVGVLLLCYIVSSLTVYPHYISYYNHLGGGANRGYLSAVDSNYDWGQDFYRLNQIIEEKEIDEIHLDYFGGEDPNYWLKGKYIPLNPKDDDFDHETIKGWIAISTNELMGGLGDPVPGFDQQVGYYKWIEEHELVGRAGKSILIFYAK